MPAERSRASRRSGADGNQLVWTMPVEPATSGGIAFATNVTPITFNEPVTDKESNMFPSVDDSGSPRRPAHSKKKPENHIPRPPNAFILFRSSFIKSQHVSTEVETNHSTLSKIIGLTWQNLPEDERRVWHAKAKQALDDHKRKFPQYAFRPLHSKGKGGTEKRKVREVGPKDLKRCAKIAELLVEGKKGLDLNAAIQEFDKHHVPEIVTRFEAPITEHSFRRSKSHYVGDTDIEDEVVETRASSPSPPPSRSRSPSKALSRSSSSRSLSQRSQRSVSPGPPPLVDPPPDFPETPIDGTHAPPIAISDPYPFSSKLTPSFDPHTFPYNQPANSTSAPNPSADQSVDPLFSEESFCNGLAMFGEDTAEHRIRPSLSINTSLPPIATGPSVQSWTHTLSPLPSSDSLAVPITPGYHEPLNYQTYDPYLSPLSGHHTPQLSHSPSLSAASSYEDLSSMYRSDAISQQCVSPSPVCNFQDGNAYSNDFSIFVHEQDASHTDFMETYGSLTMPLSADDDDLSLLKAKSQGLFQTSTFDLDFSSTFGLVGPISAY
ncbi:hypothetical protein L218DRAFT_997381 [Marasmius fiardii PR-910]|nr:hypothetical protein L218DRAFT_997381 [Marasmius fiardii PR-910]